VVYESTNERLTRLRKRIAELTAEINRGQNIAQNQTEIIGLKQAIDSEGKIAGFGESKYGLDQPSDLNSNTQSDQPTNWDDDGDEDDDQFDATPTAQNRGTEEQEALQAQAQADQAKAAEQARAEAQTPTQDQSVPPQPGISGDMKPPAQQDQGPNQEEDQPEKPTAEQPAQKTDQQPSKAEAGKELAEDAAKKGIENWFKKTFTKEFLMSLVTNPYFWGVVIALILIIIAIALFAYFFSVSKSGANGKTPVQAVNVIDNGAAIDKLKALTGTPLSQATDIPQEAQKNLEKLKTETTDPVALAAIQAALDNAAKCITATSKSDSSCTDLPSLIEKALVAYEKANPTISPIEGKAPVDDNDLTFNSDLHLGTPLRPASSSDTDGHGTYFYTGENKCDGVDVYTANKANVYPAFTGTVVKISDDASGNGTKMIVIKHDDYQILYAFITPDVQEGYVITQNDIDTRKPIGHTSAEGTSVVHIEFTYCGVCLVTNNANKRDHDGDNPIYTTWGEYYWSQLKEALTIAS